MKELFSFNSEIKKHKHVVIYGCGYAGQHMFFRLLQQNVKVDCYADSNPDSSGKKIMNIPVMHINDLPMHYKGDAAIVVCGHYGLQVAAELEKMGYENLYFDYGNDANVIHLEREEKL